MKLKVTSTFEITVGDLAHWNASTIEEAAANQAKRLYSDPKEMYELLLEHEEDIKIKVEPIK